MTKHEGFLKKDSSKTVVFIHQVDDAFDAFSW
jgi:hypothetical protein